LLWAWWFWTLIAIASAATSHWQTAISTLAVAIVTRVRDTPEARPSVFASPRVDRGTTAAPKPEARPAPPAVQPPAVQPADPPPADPPPVVVEPAEPAAPPEPSQLFRSDDGPVVDDDAARRMLEDLERDARTEMDGVRAGRRRDPWPRSGR
jgi:hypothetical protein